MLNELYPVFGGSSVFDPHHSPAGERFSYQKQVLGSAALVVVVFAGVIGIPREERATFKRWSDALTDIASEPGDGDDLTQPDVMMQMGEYFQKQLADRREAPETTS